MEKSGKATKAVGGSWEGKSVRRAGSGPLKLFRDGKLPMELVDPREALAGYGSGGIETIERDLWMAAAILHSSDLHKGLEAAWGKADGQVPGKYKRARFFGFETESLYLVAITETGARGSGWTACKKGDEAKESHGWMSINKVQKEWDGALHREIEGAMREILLSACKGDPSTEAYLKGNCGGTLAWLERLDSSRREKDAMESDVAAPIAKPRGKKMAM